MAQLRCCTAPELLCSHLYKSDAIDIERIDTSIREKHAKQLVFFFCFCPPLAFFHSMPGSRQKEGISFHCLIYALRTYISFWYFSLAKTHPAWNQNDDQHHGRQPPHVCVCAKWHKLQQMGEAKRIKDLKCVFSPFHFKMALQKPLLLLLWV